MHRRKLLTISLCLNALLLGVVGFSLHPNRTAIPSGQGVPSTVTTTSTRSSSARKTRTPPARPSWSNIQSDDLWEYLDRLRTIRCPEKAIEQIIFAEVDRRFLLRRAAFPVSTNFWMTPVQKQAAEHDRRARESELARETQLLVKDLLGVEWRPPDRRRDLKLDEAASMFGDLLSDEKLSQFVALFEKCDASSRADYRPFDVTTREDIAASRSRAEQFKQELDAILSPAEREELALRWHSFHVVDVWGVADQFGSEMNGAELREVLRITRADEDPFGEMVGYKQEKQAPDPAKQQAQEAAVRTLLGEDRFQAFLRAKDFEFRFLNRLITRELKLPNSATVAVYDVRQAAEAQARQLRADAAMGEEQRRAALDALHAETIKSLGSVLGPQDLDRYVTKEAQWFDKLKTARDR